MRRFAVRFVILVAAVLLVFEVLTLLGAGERQPGDPGLLVPDGSVHLGQPAAVLVGQTCWGLLDYTASCQLALYQSQDVLVKVAVQENRIVMATYEAESLINIYDMVRHWGEPLQVEQRANDIYLSWEHFVTGVIKPNRPGSAPGYTLTAWTDA